MAKRTVQHLKNHLSVFEPGFPIQNGYIARLLLEHSVPNVIRQVKAIVEAVEPNKNLHVGSLQSKLSRFKRLMRKNKTNLTNKWPSLIMFFLESFRIPFRLPPAVTSTPLLSSSGSPEQTSDTQIKSEIPQTSTTQIQSVIPQTSATQIQSVIPQTFDTLIQLNNGQTSTPTQIAPSNQTASLIQTATPTQTASLIQTATPIQTAPPINSQSGSATSNLPSPMKLKRDCANCVAEQNANMNILRRNQQLRHQLREFKMLFIGEDRHLSLTRFNEEITRQTESVNMWRAKYAALKTACGNTPYLVKLEHVLEQKVKTLEEKLIAVQVENINKATLIEQLKSMHEKTKTDDYHLKSYNYRTHGPEMEINQELPWEEHPERSWWNEPFDSDEDAAISQDVASNVSVTDMLCGERCQVEADGDCYMEIPEVLCEHINTEDVNQRITVENVEQPDLLSENEAASLYSKLCRASSHSDV